MLFAFSANPLEQLLIDYVAESVADAEQIIIEGIMERAPVDTGLLRESLTLQSTLQGDSVIIDVGSRFQQPSEYGLYQDIGANNNFRNIGWWSDAPWEKWVAQGFGQ